jgi:tetrahydromethanopterin S-methyltransferase subunit G
MTNIEIEDARETLDAMDAVVRTEDEFHDTWKRLPSIDDLNEYIEAMQTAIRLEDELQDARQRLDELRR